MWGKHASQDSNNASHTQPRKRHIIKLFVIIFVAISAGFAGGWLGSDNRYSNTNPSASEGRQIVREQSTLISSIAEEVGPSVVSVDVTSNVTQDSFFGPQARQQQSAGTGFIVSESGYVVTNRHVIPDGVTEVNLTMSDGTVLQDVSVVGKTSESDSLDVGILKINDTQGETLQPVKLGDSSEMKVGDLVVAIGNALGQFQNTVTSGIISGYGRNVVASDGSGQRGENLQNLFQTDAAINQGNSGGPLVNNDGEVIGINTAVAGGSAQNIGFSIPINDAKSLIESVLDSGKLERPYLGVQYIQLTPGSASELGLSVEEGAYINAGEGSSAVISGSPADQAGLESGDIIVKVNDQAVNQENTLASVIGRFKVGESVKITYIRDGKEQTTDVKLAALPN